MINLVCKLSRCTKLSTVLNPANPRSCRTKHQASMCQTFMTVDGGIGEKDDLALLRRDGSIVEKEGCRNGVDPPDLQKDHRGAVLEK